MDFDFKILWYGVWALSQQNEYIYIPNLGLQV